MSQQRRGDADGAGMTQDELLREFRACGALLEGHFLLSSGRHSRIYFQAARVLMEPKRAERLARALAQNLPPALRAAADYVVAPALGGLVIGHELARALNKPFLFVERDRTQGFALRRGFAVARGAHILLAEDVVTTGQSLRETASALRALGANIVGAAALVDRSDGKAMSDMDLHVLARLAAESFAADKLPPDLRSQPVQAPGSRPHSRLDAAQGG